jgi:diguanylate cyclase (GGDEF)-like protein
VLATRQNRARLSLWLIAPAYLLLHAIVATRLPDSLAPLSTFCIVLAELAAIAAALRASRGADYPVRALWLLLAGSLLFHSAAMSLDVFSEFAQTPVFNHVPRLQIFFSMLYEVPLLVIVSMQTDRRIWAVTRATHALLSIAVGAVLYVQLFTLLAANGSSNPADALLIVRLFDAIDIFLAAAATLRWLGSDDAEECAFFRILSIFLWINALLPAIHNRILLQHDHVWLDLFISAPYVLLFVLILTARQRPTQPISAALVRAVRSGSPIFLTMALVFVGIVASRSHFYLGMAAVLFAIAGYGALNVFTQSRVLETEESLLASKRNLEKLVGMDSLTGIANRRAFDRVLDREFATARRSRLPVSLLMIDVDHFKQFNDENGHLSGDECLVRIAAALRQSLPRATDFVARYGGEEFTVVLPATDSAGAAKTAGNLLRGIADLGLAHPTTPSRAVSISIGISTFDGLSHHSQASLIRAADRALYLAKAHGRNCSEFLSLDGAGVGR